MSSISSLLEKNNEHHRILTRAGAIAKEQSLPCYLVGGYVRDTLLNLQTSDIDLMVVGDGIKFAHLLSKALGVNLSLIHI